MSEKPNSLPWQHRYWAVLQYMLEHPAAKLAEVAKETGYSYWHVSRISSSPEFRKRIEKARMEAVTEAYMNRLEGWGKPRKT